jgi:hypothetical protein
MSMEAISPPRQRMIEDMSSRKRSPDTATVEDIRLFQLHLAETGMSKISSIVGLGRKLRERTTGSAALVAISTMPMPPKKS